MTEGSAGGARRRRGQRRGAEPAVLWGVAKHSNELICIIVGVASPPRYTPGAEAAAA